MTETEPWLPRDERGAVREVIEYVHGCGGDVYLKFGSKLTDWFLSILLHLNTPRYVWVGPEPTDWELQRHTSGLVPSSPIDSENWCSSSKHAEIHLNWAWSVREATWEKLQPLHNG